MIGSTISHYRIISKLGEGGMGVVYQARDTRLDRLVALKFLPATALPDAARQRFVQEAQAAARIHHPNICPIYEISEHDGRLFFAMAYIEGKTIRQMSAAGPLALDTAIEIAIQIAAGLEAAHREGIVHRDIKSGNVVVDQHGNASILDFGLALRPDSERLTMPGGAVGTPAYMSPEQAKGLALDHRTDLWSLGVVLFEMLTGTLPFRRDNQMSTLFAIVNEEPAELASIRPDIPPELDACLKKALAKDPAQRWQSAMEMSVALRRVREMRAPGATQTIAAVPTVTGAVPMPAKRGNGTLIVGALVAVAVAVAGTLGVQKLWVDPALPSERQIAVLPFKIIGSPNDETLRALADGLVETLTAKLSQVEDFQGKLLVVPASEVRSKKDITPTDARKIYGANLAITGTAQRWGERIQFNQVLVDTVKMNQLGSNTFEFDADRQLAIRASAVDGAVRMLALRLTPATSIAMKSGETEAPGAYGDYLRGVGYLARYDVAGNVDRAIVSLESATKQDQKYALAFAALGDAHWRKAKLTLDKKESERALASIREALRIDPRLTAARIKLGEIYSESGRPELAIKEEQDALLVAPGSAQAYRALGAAFEKMSRFAEAETAYQQGISRAPADWYGYLLLGIFYGQRGRVDDERSALETARRLTPDNEVVYANLAGLDLREGKYQNAIDLYRKASFQPGARTYLALGLANYYLRRYEESAANFQNAINLDPGSYQTWGNLGTVDRHIPGNAAKAQVAFRKAIELAERTLTVLGGDFRAHANLAEYYAKLGEQAKALAEIEQIPVSARGPFFDRIVLVYEFGGNRAKAIATVRSIPADSAVMNYLKNDPDLEGLWREIAAHPN